MNRRDPDQVRRFWTPKGAAALETEEIITRLRDLGVDASREAYLELAESRTSAGDLSEVWRQDIGQPLSRHDRDFMRIAACELWKRFCPERPSVEMLEDWMQEGYDLAMTGRGSQACDRWWPIWEVLRSRMTGEMRTCDRASVVFDGTQALYNWVQDFTLELYDAALDEIRFAETGVRLCEEVLAQFPEEDDLFVLDFRGDLGEFLYLAGRPHEGERALLDLIRDFPDRAAGYVRLADILVHGARPGAGPLDPERAQKLLETALAYPVRDAADFDVEARLDGLRASQATCPG